jgi:hypothetical protein
MATFQTYTEVGIRKISDIITNISPRKTPFRRASAPRNPSAAVPVAGRPLRL